jgi:DNA replication protein DnaC
MMTLPPKTGEILLELILRRYENRSTIMTSNRPVEEWGKLLNDVPTATAILDRFLHHAEVIHFMARSYRMDHAVTHAQKGNSGPKPEKKR